MKANWFVGLPVRSAELESLLGEAPDAIRAYDADDLHVTVAFFGAMDENLVRAAWEGHEFVLPALFIRLAEAHLFGGRGRGTALGFKVEAVPKKGRMDEGVLADMLRVERDVLLAAAGARPDEREPRPHVTVARLPRMLTSGQRRKAMRWAELATFEDLLNVERIALYTSADERPARRFRIVDERRLVNRVNAR